jgi:DNA-binding MarR family transcriptional regulator
LLEGLKERTMAIVGLEMSSELGCKLERRGRRAKGLPAAAIEFDLIKAWAGSTHGSAYVYQAWRALYRAYGAARQQFPGVDWISLVAILDIIAVSRAHRRRVDVSYLAEELGWPRTTTLSRLRRYSACGYLVLSREGRHTYIDNTLKGRQAAIRIIDVLIDSIERPSGPR